MGDNQLTTISGTSSPTPLSLSVSGGWSSDADIDSAPEDQTPTPQRPTATAVPSILARVAFSAAVASPGAAASSPVAAAAFASPGSAPALAPAPVTSPVGAAASASAASAPSVASIASAVSAVSAISAATLAPPPPPSPPPSPAESDLSEEEGSDGIEEEEGEGEEEAELGTFGQWQLQQSHAERRSLRLGLLTPTATAYLTQLFFAARFATLSPEIRFEQLAAIASHMMVHLLEQGSRGCHREPPPFIKPPGGRGGEAGRPPAAWKFECNDDGEELCPVAVSGPPVPSRRAPGSTSPSVLLTPGRRKSTGATYPSILQLCLYDEARMQLDTLLAQLPLAARPLRCFAELQHLHACAGKELANPLRFSARLDDPKVWRKLARPLVRSKHLQAEVLRVLLKLEEVCAALLDRLPGDPFDESHALDAVVDVLLTEAPIVADFLQARRAHLAQHRHHRSTHPQHSLV